MITIQCIQDIQSFCDLMPDWNKFDVQSPMRRFAWQYAWLQAYHGEHTIKTLVARRDDRIIGILPLIESNNSVLGHTLEFIGSGKACSDDLGIICQSDDNVGTANAFAQWLGHDESWDHINLDGIRANDAGMIRFAIALGEATHTKIENKPSPNAWVASLAGGESAVLARMSSRMRKILKKSAEQLASGQGKYEIATELPRALELLDIVESLHQSRWKERGIDGCFSYDHFGQFLRNAVNELWNDPVPVEDQESLQSSQRRVHIGVLTWDGQPAAGSISLFNGDTYSVYLTGMSPEFGDHRPGWQMHLANIRHALAMGCHSIDFLRGDEGYKERLGAQPITQERWLIASPRMMSQIRHSVYKAAVSMRDWFQSNSSFGMKTE